MTTIPSLRRLFTFADEGDEEEKTSCSVISVKGDATYCIAIDGPVCGKPSHGACPSEGDAAIGHCVRTSRSFSTGCVAPVDVQCVISALGHWECVFPDTNNASTTSTALDDKTPTPTPVATQVKTLSGDKVALSATTKALHTDSVPGLEAAEKAPNAALNVTVGAACCIFAFVGIALAKKRRNAKQASGSMLSHSDSSIVTL